MTTAAPPTLAERMAISHPSTAYAKAALWQDFVDLVLDVLTQSAAELRKAETWSDFSAREGWWLGTTRKVAAGVRVTVPSEDALTDALTEIAERIGAAAAAADPLVGRRVAFDPQVRRPPHGRIGRKALTTDIRARLLAMPELEVRIEAKLLFNPGDLIGAYSGRKGLLRFADPRHPYTDQPIGFMLGYSLRDQTPDWAARATAHLATIAEVESVDEVTAGGDTHPVSDLRWGADERQKVSVLHLFMDFDTEPSCRTRAREIRTG